MSCYARRCCCPCLCTFKLASISSTPQASDLPESGSLPSSAPCAAPLSLRQSSASNPCHRRPTTGSAPSFSFSIPPQTNPYRLHPHPAYQPSHIGILLITLTTLVVLSTLVERSHAADSPILWQR
ncbi:hypothetical protein BDZ97DRAFT_822897 [Flammula alnicola]|nr:hypothetical protein BDZ97DRAFT_822897 [Flammula alnicola]